MDERIWFMIFVVIPLAAALIFGVMNVLESKIRERRADEYARARTMRDKGWDSETAWLHVQDCDGCPDCTGSMNGGVR